MLKRTAVVFSYKKSGPQAVVVVYSPVGLNLVDALAEFQLGGMGKARSHDPQKEAVDFIVGLMRDKSKKCGVFIAPEVPSDVEEVITLTYSIIDFSCDIVVSNLTGS